LIAKKRFYHKLIALALCFCMIAGLSASCPPGALASDAITGNTGIQMSDISGHWAQDSIQEMVKKGIIKGYPDGTFRPGGVITRAEFAHLTVVALGLSGSNGKGFEDTVGHWAEQSIKAAVEHEIITGYSESRFGPNDSITREQAAIILVKALGITSRTGQDFVDREAISSWAIDAVACASAQGILSGYPDGSFKPQANVTRAQAAVILQRSLQVKGDLTSVEPEEEEVYAAPASPGSSSGSTGGGGSTSSKVNISAISGISVPTTGQTPVSTINATAQYTGTVTWSPADSTFQADTVYTATITLTAKSGYTLNGVTENFFTVAEATSVSNTANSGVVTAVFPATAEQITEKSVYDIIFDPTGVIKGQAKETDFTLKAVEVKDEGYDRVRINVSVTEQPLDSTVSLVGNYGAGPVNVIDLGYWGPETGHAISDDYDLTYPLIALFSKAGQYIFSITLRDLDAGTDILSKTVTVTVSENAGDDYFTFDENTGTITAYHPQGIGGQLPELLDVAIPSAINSVSVTAIGNNAFQNKGLTTVIIPDSVISIGEYAFENNNLTSVSIGNGVETIGKDAFQYNKLTHVTIGNSVKIINDGAFYRGGYETLASITIPDSVETIGKYAFHMNGFTSITIGSKVKTIGESALYGNRLTSITLPGSLMSIGPRALMDNNLSTITIGADVTIGDTLLRLHKDGVGGNLFRDAYEAGGKTAGTYTGTQRGEWTKVVEGPDTYTLTLTGDNISSDPAAGTITENTSVTVTVSPAAGKQVASFTVGGVDKKAELAADPVNQYTFSITANTIVAVSYEDIPAGEFTLNLLVNPANAGWAYILDGNQSTSGTFAVGAQVEVGCMPASNYAFVNWTVDGDVVSEQESFTFTMPQGYTNLRANLISTATAPPPTLNADSTGNYAGQNLMITFSNGQAWANAITQITVDGETLSLLPDNLQYYINPGDEAVDGLIQLFGGKINALLTPGIKEIRVKSTGYADAVLMQEITATYFDRAEFSTQPLGPAVNGGLLATQPIVKLYDKYDNLCIYGPSSTRQITLQKASGDTWTLGGTVTVSAIAGVATFTDITATNPSGLAITDARLMYEVVGSPNQYFYSNQFTIPGATGLMAPNLTADTSDNYAGANITIILQSGDWDDWLNAITAVKVGNDTLTTPEHYNIGVDNLTLLSANITQLQKPGTYTITVEAAGYNNAMVSQEITAGPQASAQFTTQPQGPSTSGGQLQQQPVVTLYDKYGNVCANGPSSNASITLKRADGDSWTIGGTNTVSAVNGVATFTDLTASNPSGAPITDARIGYTFQGTTTYSDYFTVPGLGSQTSPTLTADNTDNYAGNIIEITFTDDPNWRAAVNSIIIGVEGGTNIQLFGAEGVAWKPGRLILDTSKIPGLQKRHYGHLISIAAPNYEATITYQAITSGIATSITIDTQPQGPAANGGNLQSTPGLSLFDAYDNQCFDGPSSSVAVKVEKTDDGDWVLGGIVSRNAYQGSVTFGGLSAYNLTGIEITDAKLKFTVDGTAVTVDSNTFTIPPGSAGGAPPVFTPDADHNYVGYNSGGFTINYTRNDDWTNQVITVGKLYLDATELIQGDDYYYYLSSTDEVYYLGFYEPQNYFKEVRDYIIRIEAAGYIDAVIVQPITNGAPSYMVIDVQPGSPSESGELLNPQPVVKLYDEYDNLCTVIRGVFPGGASPQIMADKYDNDASNLWYLAGTKTVDMVDGIAAFTGLSAVSHNPDVSTEGLQVRFLLQLSGIDAVSEVFTIPPQTYSLSLEASPATGGTATIDGGGSSGNYTAGSPIAITAAANSDYAFVNWTVGGEQVSDQASFTYTMPTADTTLVANFKSTLPQATPSLTPDTEFNAAGFWIEIRFSYNDESYGDAITAIEVDGVKYTNTVGQNDIFMAYAYAIELNTYNIPLLVSQGDHEITVKADGYQDAVVTQFITAGSINGDQCATLTGPMSDQTYSSGQPLPPIKIQLKDMFGNNLIDGPDFGIGLTAEIPMGYGSGSTLSGTLTAAADANGQITFDNIVVNLPDVVNQANVALKFTGTNSLSYGVEMYLTNPGTEDVTVFTLER